MPDDDPKHDEKGRFRSKYAREDFFDALEAEDGLAGTQDVADHVGCSYELAYKRLRELKDEGDVESQKIANARLWMLPNENSDA
ncbi:transcriptional regulator [Natrarchaeobius chitinivorans]|uniref:Transcriptional regulator n=1 Tax=Natrarchaeobius chitinivorans TaxID=1679083 RepID=A0A3N6LLI7_NATCH|nr:transcriptional regulator [Natrarchaeobius chitinivorans]RQG89708.1 transcriptional regulator [Natrarchaeobius chitinivorans]